MAFPCTVRDAAGNIKEVISGPEVERRVWARIYGQSGKDALMRWPITIAGSKPQPPKAPWSAACKECGGAFQTTNGRKLYCDPCKVIVQRRQINAAGKRQRAKLKKERKAHAGNN